MLRAKDLLVLVNLRRNARASLTHISKRTSIPISTIFDKLRELERTLINKHTVLVDFNKLGFNTRTLFTLKCKTEQRNPAKEYLLAHPNVNSVYRINNGFDFMVEAIFKNVKDHEEFLEELDDRFKIKNKQVYYLIDDIKREAFLTDPKTLEMLEFQVMRT